MNEVLLSVIAASAGFMAKTLWDQYVDKKKSIELDLWKIRVNEVETRLREFLWPIYLRLQRDNVVWEKILHRESDDSEKQKVAHQIETDAILPNHLEIISLIESGMHFIRDDKDLENALLTYMRHIDVYRSIRAGEFERKILYILVSRTRRISFRSSRIALESNKRNIMTFFQKKQRDDYAIKCAYPFV